MRFLSRDERNFCYQWVTEKLYCHKYLRHCKNILVWLHATHRPVSDYNWSIIMKTLKRCRKSANTTTLNAFTEVVYLSVPLCTLRLSQQCSRCYNNRTMSMRPFLDSRTPRLLYASAWSLLDASAMRKHWYAIAESPIPSTHTHTHTPASTSWLNARQMYFEPVWELPKINWREGVSSEAWSPRPERPRAVYCRSQVESSTSHQRAFLHSYIHIANFKFSCRRHCRLRLSVRAWRCSLRLQLVVIICHQVVRSFHAGWKDVQFGLIMF